MDYLPEPEPPVVPVLVEEQCDSCQKWRRLPHGTPPPPDNVPWFCTLNPDPLRNSCSAPEEAYNDQGLIITQPKPKKKGRPKRDEAGGRAGSRDVTPAPNELKKKQRKASLTPATAEAATPAAPSFEPVAKHFPTVQDELQALIKACKQMLQNFGSWHATRPQQLLTAVDMELPPWLWGAMHHFAPDAARVASYAADVFSATEYSDAGTGLKHGTIPEHERLVRLAFMSLASVVLPKAESAAANVAPLAAATGSTAAERQRQHAGSSRGGGNPNEMTTRSLPDAADLMHEDGPGARQQFTTPPSSSTGASAGRGRPVNRLQAVGMGGQELQAGQAPAAAAQPKLSELHAPSEAQRQGQMGTPHTGEPASRQLAAGPPAPGSSHAAAGGWPMQQQQGSTHAERSKPVATPHMMASTGVHTPHGSHVSGSQAPHHGANMMPGAAPTAAGVPGQQGLGAGATQHSGGTGTPGTAATPHLQKQPDPMPPVPAPFNQQHRHLQQQQQQMWAAAQQQAAQPAPAAAAGAPPLPAPGSEHRLTGEQLAQLSAHINTALLTGLNLPPPVAGMARQMAGGQSASGGMQAAAGAGAPGPAAAPPAMTVPPAFTSQVTPSTAAPASGFGSQASMPTPQQRLPAAGMTTPTPQQIYYNQTMAQLQMQQQQAAAIFGGMPVPQGQAAMNLYMQGQGYPPQHPK